MSSVAPTIGATEDTSSTSSILPLLDTGLRLRVHAVRVGRHGGR
jgi:hypothetical protein